MVALSVPIGYHRRGTHHHIDRGDFVTVADHRNKSVASGGDLTWDKHPTNEGPY